MNLYLVISGELVSYGPTGGFDPPEYYSIAVLVVARTSAAARWAAWKTDDGLRGSFTGDPRDMPKLTVQKKAEDIDGPARVLSRDEEEALAQTVPHAWALHRDAPHIGLKKEE